MCFDIVQLIIVLINVYKITVTQMSESFYLSKTMGRMEFIGIKKIIIVFECIKDLRKEMSR